MNISIIIPTKNAYDKLKITLSSLAVQTYRNFECIIMDNLSSDDTQSLVSQYQNDIPNLVLYCSQDEGIYDAMNKGVSYATGEYILFMGASDTLHSPDILAQVNDTLTHQTPDVLYGDIIYLPNQYISQPPALSNRYFKSGKMICHQSIFARKETLDNYPFHLDYPFGADRDWLIHTFRDQNTFVHIPVAIAVYDTSGYTSLAVNHKAVWMESGKILRKYYGFLMLPITFIKYYLVIKWQKR
ncbi:MAG: glycosyltransferase [Lachnospiraceae bacterium]|nr:glycosyltransferase [Lachnospiraceae bacterium]